MRGGGAMYQKFDAAAPFNPRFVHGDIAETNSGSGGKETVPPAAKHSVVQ